MLITEKEERNIRRFLLGKLRGKEEIAFLDRILADNDFHKGLQIIEDEVIDDYLNGYLSEAEQKDFETYFLAAPARREKLNYAKSFHTLIEDELEARKLENQRNPFWRSLRRVFGFENEALRYAIAGSVLLLTAVIFFAVENVHLRKSVNVIQSNDRREVLAALDKLRAELERKLSEELESQRKEIQIIEARERALNAENVKLRRRVGGLTQTIAKRDQPDRRNRLERVLAVALISDTGRGGSVSSTAKIEPKTTELRVQLILEKSSYKSYVAEIQTRDGKHIETISNLKERSTRDGASIFMTLYPKDIDPGVYIIKVRGIASKKASNRVGTYTLTVARTE
jgi:regulator of replication initiation timing